MHKSMLPLFLLISCLATQGLAQEKSIPNVLSDFPANPPIELLAYRARA